MLQGRRRQRAHPQRIKSSSDEVPAQTIKHNTRGQQMESRRMPTESSAFQCSACAAWLPQFHLQLPFLCLLLTCTHRSQFKTMHCAMGPSTGPSGVHPATFQHHGYFLVEVAESFGSQSVPPHRHRAQLHGQTMQNTTRNQYSNLKLTTLNTCKHAARNTCKAEVQDRYNRSRTKRQCLLACSAALSKNKHQQGKHPHSKELIRSSRTEVNQKPTQSDHRCSNTQETSKHSQTCAAHCTSRVNT